MTKDLMLFLRRETKVKVRREIKKEKAKVKEDGDPVNNRGDRATIVGRWGTLRASVPVRAKALRRARDSFGLDAPKRIGRSPNTGVSPSRGTHQSSFKSLRWRIRRSWKCS